MMNFIKSSQYYVIVILLICVSSVILGCKKEDSESYSTNKVVVNFNFISQSHGLSKNSTSPVTSYYRYNDKTVLAVNYTYEDQVSKLASTNSTVPIWERNVVQNGVPVRILAFDKIADTLCSDIIYTIGSTTNPVMQLEVGKEYKFVAMSLYSETPEVPESASTSNFMLYPGLIYANDNIKKLSEAKIRYVVAKVEDREEDKSIFPAMYPLYFYREDNLGVISNENKELSINLKQIHSQVNYNITYDESIPNHIRNYPEVKIESNNIYYSGISESPTYFSAFDGHLEAIAPYPYVADYNKNSDLFFPKTIVCHMLNNEENAKLTFKFRYQPPASYAPQYRFLELENLPLRNGLRYTINIKILPEHKVPVGASIEYVSLPDVTNDVYWNVN